MSSKGHNQFSEYHPNKGQRITAGRDLVHAKEALTKQHHPEFGAPHFPPSENLPPQAKRIAAKKKKAKKAKQAQAKQARAEVHGDEAVPEQSYPTATPHPARDLREKVMAEAQPAVEAARSRVDKLVGFGRRVGEEAKAWVRAPVALARSLWPFKR